jgi:hypothetical protein
MPDTRDPKAEGLEAITDWKAPAEHVPPGDEETDADKGGAPAGPMCGLCGRPARGFAFVGQVRLCHPEEGIDCYGLVRRLHTPLLDGRVWTGAGWQHTAP